MSRQPDTTHGQQATRFVARSPVIVSVLRKQSAVFLILLVPPLVCALAEQEWRLSAAIGIPVLLSFAGHVSARDIRIPEDLRRVEAILVLVFVFLLSCILICPAFLVLGLRPVDALFEAASAITTTGLSVAQNAEQWPVSAHVLRAWTQWCGGLIMAIAGLALLLDRGPSSRLMGMTDFDEQNLLSSTRTHARQLLKVYLALTLFGLIGSLLFFPGYWEGPVLALAAISTGGFTPRGDSLMSYSVAGQTFIIFLSVLGSGTLIFYVIALAKGPKAAWTKTSRSSFCKVIGLSVLAYVVVRMVSDPGPDGLLAAILTALSAQTTSGFSVQSNPPTGASMAVLIAAMVIGGDVGSTAGGVKISRIGLLARVVDLVLLRLSTPQRALTVLKSQGERVSQDRVIFVAALLMVYVFTAFLLWIVFMAAGHPALPALFDIISALSTVGLSSGVVDQNLSAMLKLLIVSAMLLGRLEFFGVIILLLPKTWNTRR